MKYFVRFQILLYMCIPLIFVCNATKSGIGIQWNLMLSGLLIGPLQYVSAFFLLLMLRRLFSLFLYLFNATLILYLYCEYGHIGQQANNSDYYANLLIAAGLVLGLVYIAICQGIANDQKIEKQATEESPVLEKTS